MGNTPTDVQVKKEQLLATAARHEKVANEVLVMMAVEKTYVNAGLERLSIKNRFELFKIESQCKTMLFTSRVVRICARIIDSIEEYENAPEYQGEKR